MIIIVIWRFTGQIFSCVPSLVPNPAYRSIEIIELTHLDAVQGASVCLQRCLADIEDRSFGFWSESHTGVHTSISTHLSSPLSTQLLTSLRRRAVQMKWATRTTSLSLHLAPVLDNEQFHACLPNTTQTR